MSKSKKIVEVNGDWNSVGNFVSSSFFYAMENDTLSIDDNFVYAETSKEIYKININILVMGDEERFLKVIQTLNEYKQKS